MRAGRREGVASSGWSVSSAVQTAPLGRAAEETGLGKRSRLECEIPDRVLEFQQAGQMVWTPQQVESHGQHVESHLEGGASQWQAQGDVAGVDSQGVAAPSVPSPALDRYPVG